MSDLSDPVPWSPSRHHGPVLNYALDRSLSLLTKERAWCLESILETSSHWNQIFHSDKVGKAWPTLLSRIEDHARTLILVRTAAGAVIGAHGGAPWYRAAQFFGEGEGGDDCALFSLAEEVRIYPSTGFNQVSWPPCCPARVPWSLVHSPLPVLPLPDHTPLPSPPIPALSVPWIELHLRDQSEWFGLWRPGEELWAVLGSEPGRGPLLSLRDLQQHAAAPTGRERRGELRRGGGGGVVPAGGV